MALQKRAGQSKDDRLMLQNQWQDYLKSSLYLNHEGFFELPYLSNSPELMAESIIAIKASNHIKDEQAIYSDDAFTKGVMRYRKIEEGLWLISTDIEIRQNIISKALYADDMPADYYFLSFAVFEYFYPVNNSFTRFAKLVSTTCTFYRPRTEVTTFFYAQTTGKFFNIIFTKEWAEKNLAFKDDAGREAVDSFLNDETGFINWIDLVPAAAALSEELYQKTVKEKDAAIDLEYLRVQLLRIVSDFFDKAPDESRIRNYFPLHNPDYANVAAAEKFILNNLHEPFIGVDKLARKVNLSPTKLKMIFKSVFGFSMLQYHKEKNMLLAWQLVQRSDMHIKNIALITGYESAGKFTATFKKRFGMLPSEIREKL